MRLSSSDLNAVEVETMGLDKAGIVASGIKSGHYAYFLKRGVLRISFHETPFEARPGDLLWLGAGLPRKLVSDGPAEWILLRIRHRCFAAANAADRVGMELLLRLGRLSRTDPCLPLGRPTAAKAGALAEELVRWDWDDPSAPAAKKGLVLQLLAALGSDSTLRNHLPAFPPRAPRMERVEDALSLMETRAGELEGTHDLARRLGLSRSSLYRLFRDNGLPSPARMLEQTRLEIAERALRATDDTVLSVAMASGFGSLSSFYRAYRRNHGRTPGARRRARPRESGESWTP